MVFFKSEFRVFWYLLVRGFLKEAVKSDDSGNGFWKVNPSRRGNSDFEGAKVEA
jgi:hypothetical protein